MVKSTVKKNWWLMYDHVFLLTQRIIPLLIMAALLAGTIICLCQPHATTAMASLGAFCCVCVMYPLIFLIVLLSVGTIR